MDIAQARCNLWPKQSMALLLLCPKACWEGDSIASPQPHSHCRSNTSTSDYSALLYWPLKMVWASHICGYRDAIYLIPRNDCVGHPASERHSSRAWRVPEAPLFLHPKFGLWFRTGHDAWAVWWVCDTPNLMSSMDCHRFSPQPSSELFCWRGRDNVSSVCTSRLGCSGTSCTCHLRLL